MNAVIEQSAEPSPLMLPVLQIEVTGNVLASNLDTYRAAAFDLVSSINTDLQTDEDFLHAGKAVKWCGDIEEKLATAKKRTLEKMSDVNELMTTIDEISEQFRQKRLQLDKLTTSRREARRQEIIDAAQKSLNAHFVAMDATLKPRAFVPVMRANFVEVIKNKRTITGIQDAVNAELMRVTNAVTETANQMRTNLAQFDALNTDAKYSQLFRDLQTLLSKDCESFTALVRQRITDEDARQEKIRADAAEAERKRQEKAADDKKQQEDETARQAELDRQKQDSTAAPSTASAAAPTIQSQPQETVIVSDRVVQAETAIQPAQVTETAPATTTQLGVAGRRGVLRPTDAEIVSVLALHFRVHESRVVSWLLKMDLTNPALSTP